MRWLEIVFICGSWPSNTSHSTKALAKIWHSTLLRYKNYVVEFRTIAQIFMRNFRFPLKLTKFSEIILICTSFLCDFHSKFLITYGRRNGIHWVNRCVILLEIHHWLDSETIKLHILFKVINCVKLINPKFCYHPHGWCCCTCSEKMRFFYYFKTLNYLELEIFEICFVVYVPSQIMHLAYSSCFARWW